MHQITTTIGACTKLDLYIHVLEDFNLLSPEVHAAAVHHFITITLSCCLMTIMTRVVTMTRWSERRSHSLTQVHPLESKTRLKASFELARTLFTRLLALTGGAHAHCDSSELANVRCGAARVQRR